MKVSIIIPTLNAQQYLARLIGMIHRQTVRDHEVIVIDTESDDKTREIAASLSAGIRVIPRKDFNHGRTRNIAAQGALGEYLVFFTQDALPVNASVIENLLKPMENDRKIAVTYGRQIAFSDAHAIEKLIRGFNYPEESRTKDKKDMEVLGVKTFFCSNACAAYRSETFRGLGGFRDDTIMNEDMEFVYRALMSGFKVHYAADAQVRHSHNYTLTEQFRRYVDIGVFFAMNTNLARCSKNEDEGRKCILTAAKALMSDGKVLSLAHLVLDSAVRFLGYRIGRSHKVLPRSIMHHVSMNRDYWLS